MKKVSFITNVLVGFLFLSCKTPSILLTPHLVQNAEAYEVKGRHGWQLKQVISFGDYHTGQVKRSWTSSYRIPFIVTFQGSKAKLRFEQFAPDAESVQVYAVSRFKSNEIRLAQSFFSYPLKYENSFGGVIFNPRDTSVWWDFIVHNVDASWGNRSGGFARSRDLRHIDIRGIKKFEGQKIKNIDVLGFEFLEDGQVIGAVSIINKGKVWIHAGATTEQKQVISALASALLLRYNQVDTYHEEMSPTRSSF